MTDTDRRSLLRGVAVTGVALPVLAACANTTPQPSATAPKRTRSKGGGFVPLVSTDNVPVGGGVILRNDEVVVTQPEAGTFKAFSAVCTHAGCLVALVTDGQILCPCHGSQFSIDDGHVTRGPAQVPLPEVTVVVENGEVGRT